ncbi:MAG: UDP-N-acetylmuramoyl-tripeptide--D-alanyl-D-alanine ligase [Polyangiaceae bacterium]|nr:UDP-N-acetylmuramoyl-tripeptide--D-alanyl-D-alanine ligase [Polyangiaceae bacterium]
MATPLPKNRAAFSLAEIVLATGGEARWGEPGDVFTGVSTDSRAVVPGEVFVALVGERFDGHDHVGAAIQKGAKLVIVSRDVEVPHGVAVLRVPDTLRTFGLLGQAHRRRWAARGARRVIGITGSAGKTTTRHVTASLLASLGRSVHASVGNLNNAIGVPTVLLGLEDKHDDAVIEIGMSTPGEIAWASSLVEPDAAVVTLVADAHTEGVGSIWGVAREKSEIFAAGRPRGVAVANADSPGARAGLVRARARRHLLYGEAPDADVRLVSRAALGSKGADVVIEVRRPGVATRIEARLPLLGTAGAYASLAAVAVAVGLDESTASRGADMARALEALREPEDGRLAPRAAPDGTLVIDDAYNANPASMIASIRAAGEIAAAEGRRLVLILGVMRELGVRSDELHAEVGRAAAAARPAALVVVHQDAGAMAQAAEASGVQARRVPDASAAADLALEVAQAGDVVLVKASNSLGLSAVASRLVARS